MDPVTAAALIGGGASLLGGLYTNEQAKKNLNEIENFKNRCLQQRINALWPTCAEPA